MKFDEIEFPADLSGLSINELKLLAYDIRKFLVQSVSKTGGHLASNLGVVELTLALHSVFDFKTDRIIWDVGHQSYVHKILSGRREGFSTLRQFGGMSGFPKTTESKFDAFNTGHASTSASAAMGMARGRDILGENHDVIAVFGDGAMTGGMLFEALNDAGHSDNKVIFILNDNEMSISQNVGALSAYLQKLRQNPEYYKSKDKIEDFLSNLPVGAQAATITAKKVKGALKNRVIPTTLFDNLGLNYIGPVDGHNTENLINVLKRAKEDDKSSFIHIRTTKGKGYKPAEQNPQIYHGISPSNPENKGTSNYSEEFGKKLCELAEKNEKVVAVTGAMPLGTGLLEFSETYPERYFDVGIAEEHAVTMAAGLAMTGLTPVVPIYSTFMQRAYDQILHDVCLQNLHVVLCLDRAGIVGADGETHQGMYDISYLSVMPNMTILSPSNFTEFGEMLDYAVNSMNTPVAIRYPRGNTESASRIPFELGKAHKIKDGADILICSTGRMVKISEEIAEHFNSELLTFPTISPLDDEALINSARGKKLVVTIEDGIKTGGFGSLIASMLSESDTPSKMLICAFPDEPIIHGEPDLLDKHYAMDKNSIITRIEEKFNG